MLCSRQIEESIGSKRVDGPWGFQGFIGGKLQNVFGPIRNIVPTCPRIAVLWHGHFIRRDTFRLIYLPDTAVFFRVAVVHQVLEFELFLHLNLNTLWTNASD